MDIILLLYLAYRISKLASRKGEQKRKWVVTLILAWISGEIIGAAVGFIIFGKENLICIVLVALGVAGTFYFKINDYLQSLPDKIVEDKTEE
jgi:prolipoprotein diacylglyceryltransferase